MVKSFLEPKPNLLLWNVMALFATKEAPGRLPFIGNIRFLTL
jgi:hypothetical protein